MEILATTSDGRLSVLHNNRIQKIGFITHTKSYNSDDTITLSKTIFLHYDSNDFDVFTFTDDKLMAHAVSFYSPNFMSDVYRECVHTPRIKIKQFLEKCVGHYVIKTLGF